MDRPEKSQLSEIGERLSLIMRRKGLTVMEFTKRINSNHTTVSAMMGGRNYSLASLEQVFAAFPDVNADWLLTGQGEGFAPVHEQENLYEELQTLRGTLATVVETHGAVTTGKAFENLKKEVYHLLEQAIDHRAKVLAWVLDKQLLVLEAMHKMKPDGNV